MSETRFRCPACGFQIFNRRVAKCEACGSSLPSELLFTKEEVAKLDGEYENNRKAREESTRKARSHDFGGFGDGSGIGDMDFGGDGGCD